METRAAIIAAFDALGLPHDARVGPAAGGASGSAWRVEVGATRFVLRRERSRRLTDARLAAMAGARSAGLPAPELVRRATVDAGETVLLSWLPGRSLAEVLMEASADAPHWGHAMGRLQRRLHDVRAPADLPDAYATRPFDAGGDLPTLPVGDRLLHLDWHPLNLLADEETGDICGVVDWDNARRGHPVLDLARTASIITLDPGLDALPEPVRAGLEAFRRAWAEGYGRAAAKIPSVCQRWAARVMLADLGPRYANAPDRLERVRRAAE